MKKLLLLFFLVVATLGSSQTRPSYFDLKDTPVVLAHLDSTATVDNSAALTSAEALLPSGGVIILPAGRFKMKFHSFSTSNLTIRGQGPGATILEVGFGGPGAGIGGFTGCASTTERVTFEDFSIENPDDIPNLSPMAIGGSFCMVRRVHVSGFRSPYGPGESWYNNLGGGKAFHIDYSGRYNTFDGCVASGSMWGFSMTSEHGAPYENRVRGNTIKNCVAINCDVGFVAVAFGSPATGTPLSPYYTLRFDTDITNNQIVNCRVAFATHQASSINFSENNISNNFTSKPIYSSPIATISSDIFALQLVKSQALSIKDNNITGFYTKQITFVDPFYTAGGFSEYNILENNRAIGVASYGLVLNGATSTRANVFVRNTLTGDTRIAGNGGDYTMFIDYDPLNKATIGGITGYGALVASPAMEISEGHTAFNTIKLNMYGSSRRIGQSVATPTVDSAAIGDIYFNVEPNVSSVTGWICVHESGATFTSGLWKAFGEFIP